MKIYLAGIIIGTLILGMVNLSQAAEKNSSLILGICTDKDAYIKGEPVYCTLMLGNVGTQPVVINKRLVMHSDPLFPHEVLFYIKDPEGKLLNFIPLVSVSISPTKEDLITLNPSGFIRKTWNLAEFFSFEKEGKYTIQATYENYYQPEGMKVWKGKIISNKVEIEVKE